MKENEKLEEEYCRLVGQVIRDIETRKEAERIYADIDQAKKYIRDGEKKLERLYGNLELLLISLRG